MNANIQLAIIEIETIARHAEVLTGMYQGRKVYAVTLPAHMHVGIVDAMELIGKGLIGLKRDLAIVEASYVSKRISSVITGVVKGEHITDVGLRHLVRACEDLIGDLQRWAA